MGYLGVFYPVPLTNISVFVLVPYYFFNFLFGIGV